MIDKLLKPLENFIVGGIFCIYHFNKSFTIKFIVSELFM